MVARPPRTKVGVHRTKLRACHKEFDVPRGLNVTPAHGRFIDSRSRQCPNPGACSYRQNAAARMVCYAGERVNRKENSKTTASRGLFGRERHPIQKLAGRCDAALTIAERMCHKRGARYKSKTIRKEIDEKNLLRVSGRAVSACSRATSPATLDRCLLAPWLIGCPAKRDRATEIGGRVTASPSVDLFI